MQENAMSPTNLPPQRPSSPERAGRRRFGRAQQDHILDPYAPAAKLSEPAFCTQCGAVYQHGRWHWAPRPEAAEPTLCQACRRINDRFPAGIVSLSGPVVTAQKNAILGLVHHQEQAEKTEHPLNRIMGIDDSASGRLEVSTTDIHLPRRIGNAMKDAYKGTLAEHFDEGGYFVRVTWHRDE
jgi:hypothetical protein